MSYPIVEVEQLRDVALSAQAWLLIESAKLYGFIDGGPEINAERCEEIIAEAEAAGHSFAQDEIDRRALELICEVAAVVAERDGTDG